MIQQPPVGYSLLIVEALRSHSYTLTLNRIPLDECWTSRQRPLPDNTQHWKQKDIYALAGFEPLIPACEWSQTQVLDRAAIGTSKREEYKVSSTWALDWVGGHRQAPADLLPGKTRYPSFRRLGEHQGRSGRLRKTFLRPGFDPRTFYPVASCYTDWVILAHT